MKIIKKMWYDIETRGEIFKNIGLGFFLTYSPRLKAGDSGFKRW